MKYSREETKGKHICDLCHELKVSPNTDQKSLSKSKRDKHQCELDEKKRLYQCSNFLSCPVFSLKVFVKFVLLTLIFSIIQRLLSTLRRIYWKKSQRKKTILISKLNKLKQKWHLSLKKVSIYLLHFSNLNIERRTIITGAVREQMEMGNFSKNASAEQVTRGLNQVVNKIS